MAGIWISPPFVNTSRSPNLPLGFDFLCLLHFSFRRKCKKARPVSFEGFNFGDAANDSSSPFWEFWIFFRGKVLVFPNMEPFPPTKVLSCAAVIALFRAFFWRSTGENEFSLPPEPYFLMFYLLSREGGAFS